jgi:hypothetical protein
MPQGPPQSMKTETFSEELHMREPRTALSTYSH